jgi:hypothetical protein
MEQNRSGWSLGARAAASLAIGWHLVAILSAAWATPPASLLERAVANRFASYNQAIDQGYSYRYYAPEPPPTPVIEARLRFDDGREQTIRIPDWGRRPRMLYQRELALANHLYQEWLNRRGLDAEEAAAVFPARWAASYARHLGHVHGCREVAFYAKLHLIPPLAEVQRMLALGEGPVDLDAERWYETPQRIGVFPCDGS